MAAETPLEQARETLRQAIAIGMASADNDNYAVQGLVLTIGQARALLAAPTPEPARLSAKAREILVRVDSYFSLLWHRYTKREAREDNDLRYNVEKALGELRALAAPPQGTDPSQE